MTNIFLMFVGFLYCAIGMHVMAWMAGRFITSYEQVCGPDRGDFASLLMRWCAVALWPWAVLTIFVCEISDGWCE